MTKIFNYQSVIVLVGIVLLLVGCTGEPTTPKDAFKRSEKVMKKLNSVQVEGINNGKIYQETDEIITEIFAKEMLSVEELAPRNIEVLKEAYKNVEITEPETIQVNVSESKEGYEVLLQDEFLIEGFVQ